MPGSRQFASLILAFVNWIGIERLAARIQERRLTLNHRHGAQARYLARYPNRRDSFHNRIYILIRLRGLLS